MVEKSDDTDGCSSTPDCAGCGDNSCSRSGGTETYRRNLLRLMAVGTSVSLAGCTTVVAFGDEPEPRERPQVDTATETPTPTDGDENGTDTDSEVETYSVHYAKQGESIEVPADKSLLVAGEEQGWDLPFNCRRGVCGECTAQLWGDARERVSMQDPDDSSRRNQFLEEEEIEDGFTLTCVGYPQSDFVLETGRRESLDEYGYRD